MQIFITGTDTNVGKTIVSSWLCLHTGYQYFKPIQTGSRFDMDSNTVKQISNSHIHKEAFLYKEPLSPHLAAKYEGDEINISVIKLPKVHNLIIEGAGGVLVPINKEIFVADFISIMKLPTILVARTTLGTINHTVLSIEALRARKVNVLGVILNGVPNKENAESIEFYGKTKVLSTLPQFTMVSRESLLDVSLGKDLNDILIR